MASAEVVTIELVVDARGAVAGEKQLEVAMQKASAIAERQSGLMLQTGQSAGKLGAALNRLKAAADPVVAAQQRIERGLGTLDAAFRKGIATEQQVEAIREKLINQQIGKLDELQAAQLRAHLGMAANNNAMNEAAGVTKAFAYQQRNLAMQLGDVAQSLALGAPPLMVFMQQGPQIAQIWGPGEGGIGRALKETGNLLGGLVTKFWPVGAAAGVVALGVAGLTRQIEEATGKQVSFGDVALGVWQSFGDLIGKVAGPAIDQLVGWFDKLVDWISPGVKGAINFVVGFFAQGFQHAVESWQLLPQALGDIAIQAFNGISAALEEMLQENKNQIVLWMADIGSKMGPFGGILTGGAAALNSTDKVTLPRLANPFAGTAQFVAGNTDYAGAAFVDITAHSVDNLNHRLEENSKAATHAHEATHKLKTEMSDAQKAAQELGKSLESSLGQALSSLFSGPITNVQDALDKILGSFAGIGQSNISKLFDGMFTPHAANDNKGLRGGLSVVGGALAVDVRNADDIGSAIGNLLRNIPGGAGTLGAALGGAGIGFQTGNPLFGALGGALSGFGAGGPLGAVVGGIAGTIVSLFDTLEKAK